MWLSIPTQPLQHLLKIKAKKVIDGGPISIGSVTLCAKPLLLQVSAAHKAFISFLVTATMNHPIILGVPWMCIHDPQISWQDKEIKWSEQCFPSCLHFPRLTVASMSHIYHHSHPRSISWPQWGVQQSQGHQHAVSQTERLCQWPPAWYHTPTKPHLSNIPYWAASHGRLHPRSPPAGVHLSIYLHRLSRFCREGKGRPPPLHWLPRPEPDHN